ncbi:MAG: hypothetical protein VB111_12485 [Clostridiaceae bacterium]|nr:hypothetical protein [Clostridiaceae bacterium]
MSFQPPKFTIAGKTLQLRGLQGDEIRFTKLKMGDGALGTQAPSTLTDLVHPLITVSVQGIRRGGNYVTISGTFSNAGLQTGFYWREIGLFAADPDDPDNRDADILYAYQNAYDLADYIADPDDEIIEKVINFVAIVGDAENVSAEISQSLVFITQNDYNYFIEEHNHNYYSHDSFFVRKVNQVGPDENGNVNTYTGAQELFVNGACVETTEDGTEAFPFKTVQGAVNAIFDGAKICTIRIAAGTYAEDVAISNKPITTVILQGTAGARPVIKSVTASRLKELRIDNCNTNGTGTGGAAISIDRTAAFYVGNATLTAPGANAVCGVLVFGGQGDLSTITASGFTNAVQAGGRATMGVTGCTLSGTYSFVADAAFVIASGNTLTATAAPRRELNGGKVYDSAEEITRQLTLEAYAAGGGTDKYTKVFEHVFAAYDKAAFLVSGVGSAAAAGGHTFLTVIAGPGFDTPQVTAYELRRDETGSTGWSYYYTYDSGTRRFALYLCQTANTSAATVTFTGPQAMLTEHNAFRKNESTTTAPTGAVQIAAGFVYTSDHAIPAVAAAATSGADTIALTLDARLTVMDGVLVQFKAPVDSHGIEYVTLRGVTYRLVDACGNPLHKGWNVFYSGKWLSVLLDKTNGYAYLQNSAEFSRAVIKKLRVKLSAVSTYEQVMTRNIFTFV